MTQIITLADADAHLRLDLDNDGGSPLVYTDDRVPAVYLKMESAEALILNYLEVKGDVDGSPPAVTWSDRDRTVVQAAILLALSALWDDENQRTLGDYMGDTGAITLLLARLRKPALA